MRLILLGPPGAGKGTQAELICYEFEIAKISTGDMLRAAVANNTAIGQSVKKIISEGGLVPDEVIIEVIKERLLQKDCQNGYLLDGFPRTIPQAEAMVNCGITLDYVIELIVPDQYIINRMSERRVHPASGRVYHLRFNPPGVEDLDDITQEPLIQREDDKEEVVRKRLQVYHQETEPMVQWFKARPHQYRYEAISGIESVAHVHQHIVSLLRNLGGR